MIDKDKTTLLRRNTMRGRLIVTQRHRAEMTWSFVDSPDCEMRRMRERIEISLSNRLSTNRHATSNRTMCDVPPHGTPYCATFIR
jgi:hypothetical protein